MVARETVNRTPPIVAVVPLASRRPGRRVHPTEVLLAPRTAGQPEESIALVHQLRTLSTRRLGIRLGGLDDPALRDQIRAALRLYPDLETERRPDQTTGPPPAVDVRHSSRVTIANVPKYSSPYVR